ncbi:MAG TPA: mechanosensitive ion channel family protein [Bacilli bacterium]
MLIEGSIDYRSLVNHFNIEGTFALITDQIFAYFNDPVMWTSFLLILLKILVIFFVGRIFIKLSSKTISHLFINRESHPLKFDTRRTKTIGKLISNVISYTVNFIIILMILSQLNVDLAPLLAGAGVVGLAIGFGAQNLVKDVISGFFIIFEDQFSVGDVIQTGSFKGTVEEIGLRVTIIKSWTGEVHIIPNGSINQVTNFSMNNSIGVVDVAVPHNTDIVRAIEVIKETAYKVFEGNNNMIKEPEVLGVQNLSATEVYIRLTFECKANTHHSVARLMNEQIKINLDATGIVSAAAVIP